MCFLEQKEQVHEAQCSQLYEGANEGGSASVVECARQCARVLLLVTKDQDWAVFATKRLW